MEEKNFRLFNLSVTADPRSVGAGCWGLNMRAAALVKTFRVRRFKINVLLEP